MHFAFMHILQGYMGLLKMVLKIIVLFLAPAQPVKAKYILYSSNISFYWSVKPNSVSSLVTL